MKAKFKAIIERVEYLRSLLKLNKSRFSDALGMKPQTYNNFIGQQASKPNAELILGCVEVYNASPEWLLTGRGPVFRDESEEYVPRSATHEEAEGRAVKILDAVEDFAHRLTGATELLRKGLPARKEG